MADDAHSTPARAPHLSAPTRRALFTAAPVVALAVPLATAATATPNLQATFVSSIEALFPRAGGRAALNALRAGMQPRELTAILTAARGSPDADWWPALMFAPADGAHRAFRPCGEDA